MAELKAGGSVCESSFRAASVVPPLEVTAWRQFSAVSEFASKRAALPVKVCSAIRRDSSAEKPICWAFWARSSVK